MSERKNATVFEGMSNRFYLLFQKAAEASVDDQCTIAQIEEMQDVERVAQMVDESSIDGQPRFMTST